MDSRSPDAPSAAQPLLLRQYQQLTKQHLDGVASKLFADFTGLHFHVAWVSSSRGKWDTRSLPTGCDICARLRGTALPATCQTCGPRQLDTALRSNHQGHTFTCRLGVRNCWFPITIRGAIIGIAFVQALVAQPNTAVKRRAPAAKRLTQAQFDRAARLLRLIVRQAEAADHAELSVADTAAMQQSLREHEREETRLRQQLHRILPVVRASCATNCPEPHAAQIVHRLLDCIHRQNAPPVTLKNCARQLGMNPAYLSTLFAQTVGVPFKTYVNEHRLETAKSLLDDPARRLAEVATAAGYASENRFRSAFKKATGLSPKVWRETLRSR